MQFELISPCLPFLQYFLWLRIIPSYISFRCSLQECFHHYDYWSKHPNALKIFEMSANKKRLVMSSLLGRSAMDSKKCPSWCPSYLKSLCQDCSRLSTSSDSRRCGGIDSRTASSLAFHFRSSKQPAAKSSCIYSHRAIAVLPSST